MLKVIIVLPFLLISTVVFAQGFGVDDGISIKFNTETVNLQTVIGLDSWKQNNEWGDDYKGTDLKLAEYISFPVANLKNAKLYVWGGLGIVPHFRYDPKRKMDFFLRVGLEPEAMISEKVSVSCKLGFQFYKTGGSDNYDNSIRNIGLWWSIGVHWYGFDVSGGGDAGGDEW